MTRTGCGNSELTQIDDKPGIKTKLAGLLANVKRILTQQPKDKNKLYVLHYRLTSGFCENLLAGFDTYGTEMHEWISDVLNDRK